MFHNKRKCTLSTLPIITPIHHKNKSLRILSSRNSVEAIERPLLISPLVPPLIYSYEKFTSTRAAIGTPQNPPTIFVNQTNHGHYANYSDFLYNQRRRSDAYSNTLLSTPLSAKQCKSNNLFLKPPRPAKKASILIRNNSKPIKEINSSEPAKCHKRSYENSSFPISYRHILSLHTPVAIGKLMRVQYTPRQSIPKIPMIIIHLEGVLIGKVTNINNYYCLKPKGSNRMIRAGAINGLKTLSQYYTIVLYSSSSRQRIIWSFINFAKAYKLTFDAVYCNKKRDEFNDYSQIFMDFSIESDISTHVLILCATESLASATSYPCCSQCASDDGQLTTYSNLRILYIPHMMFSDNQNKSVPFTLYASLVIFISMLNRNLLTAISFQKTKIIKISINKNICLEFMQNGIKDVGGLNFGKYRLEIDEYHLTRNKEVTCKLEYDSLPQVNLKESFDILSEITSNAYTPHSINYQQIAKKLEDNDLLLRRRVQIANQRNNASFSAKISVIEYMNNLHIAVPKAEMSKIYSFISLNIDEYNSLDVTKLSESASDECANVDQLEKHLNSMTLTTVRKLSTLLPFLPVYILQITKPLRESVLLDNVDIC